LAFEYIQHIFVHEVESLRGMLEETKLHAVLLESSNISWLNPECFDALVIFKFKRGLWGAVLYLT
jgi:hypothetical protein